MYGADMEQVWSKYEGNIERKRHDFGSENINLTMDEFSMFVAIGFDSIA